MRKSANWVWLVVLLGSQNLLASSQAFQNYIEQYKSIAISEMDRSGVPASIKLAQGLLESNAGRSTLAHKANNHFGIKCGGSWKGKTYYRKDDDYKNGKLIKSCFRKYKKSTESYIAHSNFLRDNRRYSKLFDLQSTDYKNWAKGLKKAGYATSKTYDKKLIKLIEEYHLYQFDHALPSVEFTPAIAITKKEYIYVNDVKMVFAKEGDTPYTIAERLNTNAQRIVSYNEAINFTSESLAADTRVFIQKKRRKFRGRSKYHTVKAGETMYSIAQLYGIRLDKLYKRNRMSKGSQPATGEGIRLKGKASKQPRLRSTATDLPATKPLANQTSEKESTQEYTPVLVHTPTTTPTTASKADNSSTKSSYKQPAIQEHTVERGETLWRISQKYRLTVEELMVKNNLQTTTIHTGTTLRIN